MDIKPYNSEPMEEIPQKPVLNKLFFKNLGVELTEVGLMNMCQRFGEVIKIYRIDENKAFVTFETEA